MAILCPYYGKGSQFFVGGMQGGVITSLAETVTNCSFLSC